MTSWWPAAGQRDVTMVALRPSLKQPDTWSDLLLSSPNHQTISFFPFPRTHAPRDTRPGKLSPSLRPKPTSRVNDVLRVFGFSPSLRCRQFNLVKPSILSYINQEGMDWSFVGFFSCLSLCFFPHKYRMQTSRRVCGKRIQNARKKSTSLLN